MEFKDAAGNELFQMVLEKTVLQMTKLLKDDLSDFGVRQDGFYSEKNLFFLKAGLKRLARSLRKMETLMKKDGALWLESTKYGDDKDRVVIRDDGRSTYFASDIAYHHHKKVRGFDLLINVLGSDHHGYVSRLEAGLASTGNKVSDLEVILMQFCHSLQG